MEEEIKRAKVKALSLLESMDRTEAQLRLKLKQKSFSEEAVEVAIEYVKSFGYINDSGYAERFVENRKYTKSRREIFAALCQKGLEHDDIESAMEKCYEEYNEQETIRNLVKKKKIDLEKATEVEKKKLYDFLARKGFRHEDIRQVLQVSFWNA